MRKYISVVLLSVLLLLTACEEEKEPFTIGVIPSQTEGAMNGAMDKLQTYLSEELDHKVDVEIYPSYNGVVEAMNYNHIDMAFFGPLTYVIAHHKSDAQAIVTQLINGAPFYHSYIITHKDNKLDDLDELLQSSGNIDFAFGDMNSTSGSLIPSIELKKQGVFHSEENHQFHSVRYTGSHNATALAVQNKQVGAGAIDSAIYNQLIESGKIDKSQLKVIWKSDPIFQYPWAVHKDTDKETIKKLQNAFLSIKDKEILDAFGASGFTKASNEDYESIRQAALTQGILKNRAD